MARMLFRPYTRNEAMEIVRECLGLTINEANEYLNNIIWFSDKYIPYPECMSYPGKEIAELDNQLQERKEKRFKYFKEKYKL